MPFDAVYWPCTLKRQPLLRWRESLVNFLHNPLSPLNTSVDEFVRPWAPQLTPEQVVSGAHVQARENRSHDPDDTFAALIHERAFYAFAFSSSMLFSA